MPREFIVQKLWGIALVALAFFTLTPEQVSTLFIVFGQGHFLAAYLYQWKAGKIGGRWLLIYAVFAAVLFGLAIFTGSVEWFALVTSIIFFIHHFQDEASLFGKEHSVFRALEQAQPVLLYSALIVSPLLRETVALSLVVVSALLLSVYAGAVIYGLHKPDAMSAYLYLISGVLGALWMSGVSIPMQLLMGAVILFHYMCWYVYYYYRFAKNPERQRAYVRDMLGVHAVVFAAYALFVYTAPGAMVFGYFFLPIFFFVWTLLHIGSSVRLSDYRDSLRS